MLAGNSVCHCVCHCACRPVYVSGGERWVEAGLWVTEGLTKGLPGAEKYPSASGQRPEMPDLWLTFSVHAVASDSSLLLGMGVH